MPQKTVTGQDRNDDTNSYVIIEPIENKTLTEKIFAREITVEKIDSTNSAT